MIVEFAYEVSCTGETVQERIGGSEPGVGLRGTLCTFLTSTPLSDQIQLQYPALHRYMCVCARRPTHVASALCNIRSIAALRFSGGEWKAIVICDPHTPVKRQIPKTKSHSI